MARAYSGLGVTTGLAADRAALTGAVAGQQFFETDTTKFFLFNGAGWVEDRDLSVNTLGHFTYETGAGVSAGAATSGAWRQRPLTTIKTNNISGASLSSNRVTLPAGTYWSYFSAAFFGGTAEAENRLFNVTDNVVVYKSLPSYGTGNVGMVTGASGLFTLSGSRALELQYRVQTTVSSFGLGITNTWSESNVFAEFVVFKVA